jgi:CRP-like cAMP-binding protein
LAPTEAAVFVSTLPPGEPWEDIGAALLETPPARELSFIVEYQKYGSGEEVCKAGDDAEFIFLLLDGTCTRKKAAAVRPGAFGVPAGRKQPAERPGSPLVGGFQVALADPEGLNSPSYNFTVTCQTPCAFLRVAREKANAFVKERRLAYINEKKNLLRKHVFVGGANKHVNERTIVQLVDFMKEESYPIDHVLVRAGTQSKSKRLVVIRRGECRAVTPTGIELPLLTPGSVVGLANCLIDAPEAATVSAATELQVFTLQWTDLERRMTQAAKDAVKSSLQNVLTWTARTVQNSQNAVASCSDAALAAARAPIQPKLGASPWWGNKRAALESELAKTVQEQLDSLPASESAPLFRQPLFRPNSEPRLRTNSAMASDNLPLRSKPTMAHLQVSALKRSGRLVNPLVLKKMEQRVMLASSASDFGFRG